MADASRLTGMPELVLIPAPVITTTFFALYSELAISCSCEAESGVMWTVGIFQDVLGSSQGSRGDEGGERRWEHLNHAKRSTIISWLRVAS